MKHGILNGLFLVLCLAFAGFNKCTAQIYYWLPLGTDSATSLNPNSYIWTTCTDPIGNVFTAGEFTDSNGTYVARWDGVSWSKVGRSSWDSLSNQHALISSICSDGVGNLYASESEEPFVDKWDGTSWTILPVNDSFPTTSIVCTDKYNNVYAVITAGFYTIYTYVAKWNGSEWVEVGINNQRLNANRTIRTICTDTAGNLYAAGEFTDGSEQPFVAEWDGMWWYDLGPLNTDVIWALCSDNHGNVYAGTDSGSIYKINPASYPPVHLCSGPIPINALCSDTFGNVFSNGNLSTSLRDGVQLVSSVPCQKLVYNGTLPYYNYSNYALCTDMKGNLFYSGGNLLNVMEYVKVLNVQIDTLLTLCSGSVIMLNPDASGIYPPLSYAWQVLGGDTLSCTTCSTPWLTVQQNSAYQLTVTDSVGNAMTVSVKVRINGNSSQLDAIVLNATSPCGGDTTTFSVTGANIPYSLAWGDSSIYYGLNQLSYGHKYNRSGIYTTVITDSANCKSTIIDTVLIDTSVHNVSIHLAIDLPTDCKNNGQLGVSIINGTPPFITTWSNGDSLTHIENLYSGNYSLTVTDANNCSSSASYAVSFFDSAICTIQSTINAQICPGTSFSFYGSIFDTAGLYMHKLCASTGCDSVILLNLVVSDSIINAHLSTIDLPCYATGFGELKGVLADSSRIINYIIIDSLRNDTTYAGSIHGNDFSFDSLYPGFYRLMLFDSFCSFGTYPFTIKEAPPLLPTLSYSQVSCFGDSDGSACVNVRGGTAPYRYYWSNELWSDSCLFNFPAGSFSVLVVDSNLCRDSLPFTIAQPYPLEISAIVEDTANPRMITLYFIGGTPSYNINWGDGASNIQGGVATHTYSFFGSYVINITDANNCTIYDNIFIAFNSIAQNSQSPSINIYPNPADNYFKVESISTSGYRIQLSNDLGQVISEKETKQVDIFDTEKLASGVYFLKVTDESQHTIISKKLIIQH